VLDLAAVFLRLSAYLEVGPCSNDFSAARCLYEMNGTSNCVRSDMAIQGSRLLKHRFFDAKVTGTCSTLYESGVVDCDQASKVQG